MVWCSNQSKFRLPYLLICASNRKSSGTRTLVWREKWSEVMVIFLTLQTTRNGTLIGAVSFDVWIMISCAVLMDFALREGSINALFCSVMILEACEKVCWCLRVGSTSLSKFVNSQIKYSEQWSGWFISNQPMPRC